MEVTPPTLQDPGGSLYFPQQKTTKPGTGNWEEVLAATVGPRDIYTNVRGAALVRGVQDFVRIPDRYPAIPST